MARRIGMAAPPRAQCVFQGAVAINTKYSGYSGLAGPKGPVWNRKSVCLLRQDGGCPPWQQLCGPDGPLLRLVEAKLLLQSFLCGNCKDDAPGGCAVGS